MFTICLRPQNTKEGETILQTSKKNLKSKNDETKVQNKSLVKLQSKENKLIYGSKQEQVKQVTLSLSQLQISKENITEKTEPSESKLPENILQQTLNELNCKEEQQHFSDQSNLKKIMDVKIFLTSEVQDMNLKDIQKDKDLLNKVILKQNFLKNKNHFDAKEYFGGKGLKQNQLDQIFKQNKLANSINSLFSKLSCCSSTNTETIKAEQKIEIETSNNGVLNKNFIDKQFNPYPQVDSVLSSSPSTENIQAALKQKDQQDQTDPANTNNNTQYEFEKHSMSQFKQGKIRPQSHQRDKFYQVVQQHELKKSQFSVEKSKQSFYYQTSQLLGKMQSSEKSQTKLKKPTFQSIEQAQKQIKNQKSSCARKYTDGQTRIIKYIKDQLGNETITKDTTKEQNDFSFQIGAQSPQKNQLDNYISNENDIKIFYHSQAKEESVQQDRPQSPALQSNSKKHLLSTRKCLFYGLSNKTEKISHS